MIQDYYYYQAFGLVIKSSFPISSLENLDAFVAEDNRELVVVSLKRNAPAKIMQEPYHFIFEMSNAWIEVKEASQINVYLLKEVDLTTLSWYLLNFGLIALLYQRGYLPLHGCVISDGQEAIAFVGQSGAGKSSTAAYFLEHGYQYLGDEICAVKPDATGQFLSYPSYPEVGLLEESEMFLPATFSLRKRSRPYLEGKADFEIQKGFGRVPVPIKRIYLLAVGETEDLLISSVRGGEAIHKISGNALLYLSYIKASGFYKPFFQMCVQLLEKVELYQLQRPELEKNGQIVLKLL